MDDGTKCCAFYENANNPSKVLDYYDPTQDCINGDYISCPLNGKLGTKCRSVHKYYYCAAPYYSATLRGCCRSYFKETLAPPLSHSCDGSPYWEEDGPNECCPAAEFMISKDCEEKRHFCRSSKDPGVYLRGFYRFFEKQN